MFEALSTYRRVFVTGPHRTGTTICATMVAHDTGHDLVLEDDFKYSNSRQLAAFLHAGYGKQVIQCPFLCHEIHDLEYLYDIDMTECMVIMMHRDRRAIEASEARARLKDGRRVDFDRIGESEKRKLHIQSDAHISDLKYEAWKDQRNVIPHSMDVAYESLRGHPLWVEKRDFNLRQTSPDDEGPDMPPPRLSVSLIRGLRALQNI